MADLKDKSIKAPAFLNAEDVLNPEATQGVTNEQVVEYLQAIGGACQTLQGALPPKTVTVATGKIIIDRYDIVVDLDIESDNLISIIEPQAFVSKIDVSTVINDGSYIMLRADKTKNIKLVNNASADDNSIKLLTGTELLIDEKGVLLQRSANAWVQKETATGGVSTVNGLSPDENGNVIPFIKFKYIYSGQDVNGNQSLPEMEVGESIQIMFSTTGSSFSVSSSDGVDAEYYFHNHVFMWDGNAQFGSNYGSRVTAPNVDRLAGFQARDLYIKGNFSYTCTGAESTSRGYTKAWITRLK